MKHLPVPQELLKLVEFENNIQNYHIDSLVDVRLNSAEKSLYIIVNGKTFFAKTERGIIHQLGGKIFGNKLTWDEIKYAWEKLAVSNPRELEILIRELFVRMPLNIKYYNKNDQNVIYGIVTENFSEIDCIAFRDDLIKKSLDAGLISNSSSKCIVNRYGRVVETFEVVIPDAEVKFGLNVIYGKNNGYGAIKFGWGRIIIVCENGLTQIDGLQENIRHSIYSNPENIVQNLFQEVVEQNKYLLDKISVSNNINLDKDCVDKFLQNLVVAEATKDRIRNRIKIESLSYGNTEWALSQSLTWLGSHEKALMNYTKQVLTEAGTGILEKGLLVFLENLQPFMKN